MQADDVRAVRFAPTKFRQGYDQDEVDEFLVRVEAALAGTATEAVSADDIVNVRFTPTVFREGYSQNQVDDFLDQVVMALRERDGR